MTKRTYENESVRVLWDSDLCIHTGLCVKGLPGVFDTGARPWIDLDGAVADEVAAVVEQCPTGALSYERTDGGPAETRPSTTTVVPYPDGALSIRGAIEIRDANGDLIAEGTRMALCRCGSSANRPFCDMSHIAAGFKADSREPDAARDGVVSPSDISDDSVL